MHSHPWSAAAAVSQKPTHPLLIMKNLLTLVLGLAFTATAFAGEFADITIPELKKAIAAKSVTVIDVNPADSYKAGHIPTAIHFEKEKATLEKSLPAEKNALIVAYCGGPKCQAYQDAAKKAKELGYTNVKHLSAGISGWKEAGEATEPAAD
jgi:rhodanese-related sulfurtransferase